MSSRKRLRFRTGQEEGKNGPPNTRQYMTYTARIEPSGWTPDVRNSLIQLGYTRTAAGYSRTVALPENIGSNLPLQQFWTIE